VENEIHTITLAKNEYKPMPNAQHKQRNFEFDSVFTTRENTVGSVFSGAKASDKLVVER
jgi:hypothetical protein